MRKVLSSLMKQIRSLAQTHSLVGSPTTSYPTGNGFTGWKHVVLYYLRIHRETSSKDGVDVVPEMDCVLALLGLPLHGFPVPSTLYRSFNRSSRHVWRAPLGRSAELLDRWVHAAIDSTFFTR